MGTWKPDHLHGTSEFILAAQGQQQCCGTIALWQLPMLTNCISNPCKLGHLEARSFAHMHVRYLRNNFGCTGSAPTSWHNCSVATARVDNQFICTVHTKTHPETASIVVHAVQTKVCFCKFHSCDCFISLASLYPSAVSGLSEIGDICQKLGIYMHFHTTCAQHTAVPAA